MAASLSNAKLLSAFVVNAMSRRGYAASAASGGVDRVVGGGGGAKGGAMLNKKAAAVTTEKVSWVPDPKTGFYRPENHAAEIDPAELRAMLLNKNTTRAH